MARRSCATGARLDQRWAIHMDTRATAIKRGNQLNTSGLLTRPLQPRLRQARPLMNIRDKLMCARYWMERMVPECPMLLERIQAGSAVVMELE